MRPNVDGSESFLSSTPATVPGELVVFVAEQDVYVYDVSFGVSQRQDR
jgi:hypothetical protein